MPKNQGTSRKGKPTRQDRAAGMGRALQKAQGQRYQPKANGTSRGEGGMIMPVGVQSIGIDPDSDDKHRAKSVLELTDLDDFLLQADLANREFVSEREGLVVLDSTGHAYRPGSDQADPNPAKGDFVFQELSVPRRPLWDASTTPDELRRKEQEDFLTWRRGIAAWEEGIARASTSASVTPFEKNLEVWRQLWRVLERSSCLLQIVDARNPLFYLSDDLRAYAAALGKPMMCLVNKADYLSPLQRQLWFEYLQEKGWETAFFSAIQEQHKLDVAAQRLRKQLQRTHSSERRVSEKGTNSSRERGQVEERQAEDNVEGEDLEQLLSEGGVLDSDDEDIDSYDDNDDDYVQQEQISEDGHGIDIPLTRRQLMETMLAFARQQRCEPDPRYDNRIQFGMVGFPNVGKSSVINVLMGSSKHSHGLQRVAVASQPGKTKHFQTLLLPDMDEVMLCDCPGLVFPSFVSNTADLIAAGVYPIAQMRDHWPVMNLICHRIPREIINALYGIKLPVPSLQEMHEHGQTTVPPPSAEEFLRTYCVARGLLAASSGVPDYARAARMVIKDYAEGKLLYSHPPPGVTDTDAFYKETITTALNNTSKLREKLLLRAEQRQQQGQSSALLSGVTNRSNVGAGIMEFTDEDLLEFVEGGAAAEVALASMTGPTTTARSVRKWGKKDRKNRNKDPYGCHTNPDSMMLATAGATGVVVNAGKYTHGGYTRPKGYAGVRGSSSNASDYQI